MREEDDAYAIWNNKGGVGKTFLTFLLATEYALSHEDEVVFVIDMCPQSNVSEILLGGNGIGGERLDKLLKEGKRTIGDYFLQKLDSPNQTFGGEVNYKVNINEARGNDEIPKNLYLVPGNPVLEIQSRSINNLTQQDLPETQWKNVNLWVKSLRIALRKEQADDKKCVFFIDCNPSFAIYTRQALLAADQIIVPFTADSSSARSVSNIVKLLYGRHILDRYKKASFASKAKEEAIELPKIAFCVMSRSTTYKKQVAKGFKAMENRVREEIGKWQEKEKGIFKKSNILTIPDFHTASVVCSSSGKIFSKLKDGQHILTDGTKVTITGNQMKEYKKKLKELVDIL